MNDTYHHVRDGNGQKKGIRECLLFRSPKRDCSHQVEYKNCDGKKYLMSQSWEGSRNNGWSKKIVWVASWVGNIHFGTVRILKNSACQSKANNYQEYITQTQSTDWWDVCRELFFQNYKRDSFPSQLNASKIEIPIHFVSMFMLVLSMHRVQMCIFELIRIDRFLF